MEWHYGDFIMIAMASQITGISIVCWNVCSGADQRKHQSSASLAFVRGIQRWLVDSPHKGPVTRKIFPFDEIIMETVGHYVQASIHREPRFKNDASNDRTKLNVRQLANLSWLEQREYWSYHHYDDVIMSTIASQITSLTIVYSTVYSGADQSKHQSSASLAFVWGIHRGPVNSPHKWPVTRKMFPFDDVIMRFRILICHMGTTRGFIKIFALMGLETNHTTQYS